MWVGLHGQGPGGNGGSDHKKGQPFRRVGIHRAQDTERLGHQVSARPVSGPPPASWLCSGPAAPLGFLGPSPQLSPAQGAPALS